MSASDSEGCCTNCFSSGALRYITAFLGIACACAVITTAVVDLVEMGMKFSLRAVIADIFQIALGAMMLCAELRIKPFLKWFRFMIPLFGLGVFYLAVGFFALQQARWWQIMVAIVTCSVGVLNMCFGCCGASRHIEMDAIDQATLRDSVASKIARSEYAAAHARAQGLVAQQQAAASAAAAALVPNKDHHGNARPAEEKHDEKSNNPFERNDDNRSKAYE